jgi:hypothetical protein
MRPWLTLPLLLLLASASFAQTRIDAGIAIGSQSYEQSSLSPRVLTSPDVLLVRGTYGLHAALDYADLAEVGHLFATHVDLVYRRPIGNGFVFLAGAGPTFIQAGDISSDWAANAEVEIGRQWSQAELFARVRYYDFKAEGFREGASPKGPALYLGMRFKVSG